MAGLVTDTSGSGLISLQYLNLIKVSRKRSLVKIVPALEKVVISTRTVLPKFVCL